MELNCLEAISPIDGRYRETTKILTDYFSEFALIKYRVEVEIKWLLKLEQFVDNFSLTEEEKTELNRIVSNFTVEEASRIKEIENVTKHDVKAVEYYIREKVTNTSLEKVSSFIHFACTSEDISNLAYNLMVKNALNDIWLPEANKLISSVKSRALELKNVPMLAHTHGQPASPTTVGKELMVFVYRWNRILNILKSVKLTGKFGGAVGNFNAHLVAYPNLDWKVIGREFVESLGLDYIPLTTQIEPHDIFGVIFNLIKSFNTITMDFNSDMWLYISKSYFKQKTVKTEVGSSVMPHKVNPINHENSMANIRLSNAILTTLADNLPISRMQRDLSDSSSLRNIGVGFGHSILSIKQSIIGFEKMLINEELLREDLKNNPEVLSEAIQTVLRKNGHTNAYEQLKELTRGNRVDLDTIKEFVHHLDIPKEDKDVLLNLTPENYIGIAEELVCIE
jgi:adenylosuccinate lyase